MTIGTTVRTTRLEVSLKRKDLNFQRVCTHMHTYTCALVPHFILVTVSPLFSNDVLVTYIRGTPPGIGGQASGSVNSPRLSIKWSRCH